MALVRGSDRYDPDVGSPFADPTYGDYASLFANVGGADLAVAVPAATRWLAEAGLPADSEFGQMVVAHSKYFQDKIRQYGANSFDDLSPAAKQRVAATITSPEFLEHPVSATLLKLTRTAPTMVAAGASMFIPGVNAAVGAGLTGGVMSMGQTLDDIQAQNDSKSDDELTSQSEFYRNLRNQGVEEREARIQLDNAMTGAKPFVLLGLGGLTTAIGPAGQIGRAVGRTLGREGFGQAAQGGVLKRVGKEFLQGGAAEAVQTGAEAVSTEQALTQGGLQPDINWANVASATAEGALLGAIPGAIAGVPSGRRAQARSPNPIPTTNANPRAAPDNPPGAEVGITQTGPASMPPRGGNTQASQPVVPPRGAPPTPPPGARTAPPNRKKAKVATGATTQPAVETPINAQGEVLGAEATQAPAAQINEPTGLPVAPTPLSAAPGPINAPDTAVFIDSTQAAALNATAPKPQVPEPQAPMGATLPSQVTPPIVSPTPIPQVPTPRTPSQVQQETGVPGMEAARIAEAEGWRAPQAPQMPQEAPVAPVAPTLPPAPEIASTVTPEPPRARPPRVLQAAPTPEVAQAQALANEQIAARAREELRAPVEEKPPAVEGEVRGKAPERNAKRARDARILQGMMDERPSDLQEITTEEELDPVVRQLQGFIDRARAENVEFRTKVSHKANPPPIVWLREAETALAKIKPPKMRLATKLKHINEFIRREYLAKHGGIETVKAQRRQEGEERMKPKPKAEAIEQLADTTTEGEVIAAPKATKGAETTETTSVKLAKGEGASPVREVSEEVRKEIEARYLSGQKATPAATVEKIRKRAKETLPTKVTPKEAVAAVKEKAKLSIKPTAKAQEKISQIKAKLTGKAALAAELKKVDPEPTLPQVAADNASKAHFSVEGMPVAISTKKNTERQGQDKTTGRRWSWLYKHHYGHLLGTKGMDGSPVDVFLGPKAWPGNPQLKNLQVVVIDQVDPDTKAPDEHKVMLGFDTVKDAVDAYEGSYPRGRERRGDVVPMSLEEFKAWVRDNSKTSKPAGTPTTPAVESEAIVEEVKSAEQELADLIAEQEADDAAFRPSMLERGGTEATTSIEPALRQDIERIRKTSEHNLALAKSTNVASGDLSSFLRRYKGHVASSKWAGRVRKFLFTPFANRVANMAGDVQVYVLPNDVYRVISGDPNSLGQYDSITDTIYMPEHRLSNNIGFAHTLLHEGTHAAVHKASHASPELANKIQRIFDEALMNYPLDQQTPYGLANMNEMLAEAFSNPDFQNYMIRTKISETLKKELGVTGKAQSLWDVLLEFISKVFGLPPAYDSVLGAVMKVMPEIEDAATEIGRGPASDEIAANMISHWRRTQGLFTPDMLVPNLRLPEQVRSRVPERFRPDPQAAGENAPHFLKLRTLDDLAQLAKDYSQKFYRSVRGAADTAETIRVDAENYQREWIPLIARVREAERKHRASGLWDRYEQLLQDETNAGVFADRDPSTQKHLGKDTLRGAYPKAIWPKLNQEYRDIVSQAPELAELRKDTLKFYQDRQNDMNFRLVNNILRAAVPKDVLDADPDLARRLFEDSATEDDKKTIGPKVYDQIQEAGELAKIKGPYYPQMRRGSFVVRALMKITPPGNFLREIPDTDEDGKPYTRTWEFGGPGVATAEARRRAKRFAAEQTDMFPTVTSVWVDNQTGERYRPDGTRVAPSDQNAEQRFRVTIQNRYVDFFETLDEARRVQRELEQDPDVEFVKEAVPRQLEPHDRQIDYRSHHMRTLADTLQRRAGFKNLSQREQNNVVQALNEASLRLHAATRIQTRRLQRKRVLGASRDVPQAMIDYSKSVSSYMSRLDHQQDLDKHLDDMLKSVDDNDGKSNPRQAIANEVLRRIERAPTFEESTGMRRFGDRLLVTSFLSKLVSPAYNVLNLLQTPMISGPVMAARFGAGRSASAFLKAYSDVGFRRTLKSGLVASKRALSGEDLPTLVEDMKAGLSNVEKSAIDHLVRLGLMDPDAGIEINTLYNERGGVAGRLDRGLDYMQRFGRQMPRAVETINRGVTGLAAFRLELQRNGGDVEAAKLFMQETVSSTQGNYSHTNAAPIFNHPLWRMSLQFKKYGQLVYGLIGRQIGRAYRNANEGDRAEAVKTLAYMAATHVAIAGALGLPTEPLKWLVMGANLAGLTGITWADVENYERELLSSALGQQLGEIAARGITRALPGDFAFDLSSRAGLQDLFTFGEPRSSEQQDISAYMADLVGGAPYSLILDWQAGANNLFNGEFTQAAEKLAPLKVASDLIKSFRVTSEGKKTGAGFERMTPYSLGEAAIRTFGFTPAREAENQESTSYFYSKQARMDKERNELMHKWAAATGSERAKLWGQVEKFNYNKVRDEKLTRSELDRYAKRRKTEEKSRKGGFRVTRREKELYNRVAGTYNLSP